ncbi:Calcineurin-like metallo-phosphoesterase superfamily protein [Raphanus sativus]|nr:Calcineurin-like metallo-phosphoesterase superfamily protein [Raphanus sativus]
MVTERISRDYLISLAQDYTTKLLNLQPLVRTYPFFPKLRPAILTILQNCAVLSIACCIFYSHCVNRAILRQTPLEERRSSNSTWLTKLVQIDELKDQVCSSWFAPVGSASDYPLLSKWVIYGELACNGSCPVTSDDEISPIYSLWATFIGLYIANYVVERSTGWALAHPVSVDNYEKLKKQQMKPNFLDMVPWYSGTSADLFKTVFDLLVSVTVFLGRFDMRMMQAAMTKNCDGDDERKELLYDHFTDHENDFWFDFMADTGDGGNSSYSVAKLLAQPFIEVPLDDKYVLCKGVTCCLLGEILRKYPIHQRLHMKNVCSVLLSMRCNLPIGIKNDSISVEKPELPEGVSDLKHYDGPQCFLIPGNHDWFDGLNTFMRYICHKSWLGGWLMPQKKSYFALQLPKGWWVFGLDLALHGDIDVYQFNFFSELVKEKVGEDDAVIIITHEPNWLLDWYWKDDTGKNMRHLICDFLKGRCKLRMAGDLHHYICVTLVLLNRMDLILLLMSNISLLMIALGNILKFRKKNWQFDFIGGIIYFVLVFSLFPQCKLGHILRDDSFSGHLGSFLGTVWSAFVHITEQSYVSFTGVVMLLVSAIMFVPSKISRKRRMLIGVLHVAAHLTAALILMLLLELGIETCIQHKLLATSGYHTLYQWYKSVGNEHFPDPTGLRVRIEQWTFGFYPACIKYLMSAFDIPEVMAVTRTNICREGMESLSRSGAAIYYASVFLYFWVFSTPVVSLVFGSYLYICINWLHIHFDEAFSSLRIANYKSFTRFHIKPDGDLEVFTLGVDKVPKEWKLDKDWDSEPRSTVKMNHHRRFPSKWCATTLQQDPINTVKIVDHFVISRSNKEVGES